MIRRTVRAIAFALFALLAASPVGAAPTTASTPSIVLTGQPAWSTLGDDVTLHLGVRAATTTGLEVHTVVHTAILSRIAFERSLTGDHLGSVLGSRATPVEALATSGSDRILTIGLQSPNAPSGPNRFRLNIPEGGSAGVFPLEIELRDGATSHVLDHFVTDLVATRPRSAGDVPAEALHVAWLWNFAASPPRPGAPIPDPLLDRNLGPNGRLGRIATALGQAANVPISLVPDPATVDAIRADAELSAHTPTPATNRAATVLATLRTAGQAAPVLAGTYTTVDGPALIRAGLTSGFDTSMVTGRAQLESGLDAAVDHTIATPQPLDGPTLTRLRDQGGTTRVVVEPKALVPAAGPDQFTPAHPFRLDTPAGSFDALEVNAITSDLLVRPGPDALRAQQVLAGLAVIALEQPNRSRGVVINTPLLWDAPLPRVTALLAGFRDHPLFAGTPIGHLFDSVQPATLNHKPYSRALVSIVAGAAPISLAAYDSGRRQVDGLASMIGANEPIIGELRYQMLLTLAGRIRGTGPAVSTARLRAIEQDVGDVTGKITATESRTVTLTSRRASVPLSIENGTGRSVRVLVTLASQKLEFPKGSQHIIDLAPGNNTKQFDVSARASGTFPVLVTVSSPDSNIALQRSRYTVRSSVVSGVGLFLTIGALAFLAAWWLTHWRRSRRRPAASPAVL